MIEDLLFSQFKILMKKSKKMSKFQEIMLITTLMYNPKNTPYIKKLTLMNPKFKRKNYNLFSEVLLKKLKLFQKMSKFQEPKFINNKFSNLLLTERELNSIFKMVKINTSRLHPKFSQLR